MVNFSEIRKGTQIFGVDNQPFGTVEDVNGQYVTVNGRQYDANAFSRYENNRLFLADNYNTNANYAGATQAGEIRVPVAEEQLNVGKREVEQGAVRVHKTVTQEQVNVPLELRREEANIEKIDTPDRPLRAGEDAFQEATYEIPLRAEEAVVNKQAVVTGEVVINKQEQVENRQVADTVRRERVEVDRGDATANRTATNYNTQTDYNTATTAGYNTNTQTTNYATTSQTGSTDINQIREGYTVYGSDEEKVGKVKSVDANGVLVSRGFLQGDTYVPVNTVASIAEDQVMLNVPASQVDTMNA